MFGAFSTVPSFPCTANMQNMHVNCKQIFPWTINNGIICRKNAISYFEYVEYAGICKNHSHVQPKKGSIKMTEYAEKCNIVIRRSKNTSFTHIYYVCMYVIVTVHICNIYSACICVYNIV